MIITEQMEYILAGGFVLFFILLIIGLYVYYSSSSESYTKPNINPYPVKKFTTPNPDNDDYTWNEHQTTKRLDRIDPELLPKVSTSITPYNVDVADPVAYTFQVHAPRVIRKDRLAMQADPLRGDIPIKYFDVPIIDISQYNRDSLRLDGFFSDAFKAYKDRLDGTDVYANMPTKTSLGASITGY